VSFVAGIGLITMENLATQRDKKNHFKVEVDDKVSLKDMKKLDSRYWLITINSLFFYCGINMFYNISNQFL